MKMYKLSEFDIPFNDVEEDRDGSSFLSSVERLYLVVKVLF